MGRCSIHSSSSCASVCVLDRHLTHRLPLFSLGRLVFRVTHAGWELGGTTRVLLRCLPPGHVSLCVCMCFCVQVWGRQKWHDYNSKYNRMKKKKLDNWPFVCKSEREKQRMMWAVCNSSTVLPPLCFITVYLFLSCHFCRLPIPCTDVILPVYLDHKQHGQRLSPPITYTSSAQGWPRLGKDAAAFIRPLAPSAPSHSPQSAVPSIAMATAGAVDGEGCLEWQPWQESGPSNDPLGGREGEKMARRKRESWGKVIAVTVTCDYSHEVQGYLHCNLSLSPDKGRPQNTITQYGYSNGGNHIREFGLDILCSHPYFSVIACLFPHSYCSVAAANGHSLIKFLVLILPRPWHWTVGASGVVIITVHCAVTWVASSF